MGDCVYCGQSAGIFKKKHEECESKHNNAWDAMKKLAMDAVIGVPMPGGLENKLKELSSGNYIPDNKIKESIVCGWENAVEHFLSDGNLDENEERKLSDFVDKYSFTQSDLDKRGAWTKLVKSAVLRDVLNGKTPDRVRPDTQLPFNLQKGEKVIWVFGNVQYLEDKVRRQYVGGSQGVSFRIAKGVYYRVGAFKGEAIETTQRVHIDTGILGITNKHIYFCGPKKSLRVGHNKIISHIPFSDGVGIHKDGVTAKPQIFVTGDGWFIYNLLANINNIT